MSNKGLLIRSTSIQHISFALKKVCSYFNGLDIDILTHAHAANSMDIMIKKENIVIYPYRDNFSLKRFFSKRFLKKLKLERYNTIIVPVENISSTGYENVLGFALLLNPKKIAICNKAGNIKLFSKKEVILILSKYYVLFPFAFICSLFMVSWWGLYFIVSEFQSFARKN